MSSPEDDVLAVDVSDRVALLTMSRPAVRNALNAALVDALTTTVAELDAAPDVDVLILTGADPAFCAGVDLISFGREEASADAALTTTRPPWRGPFPPRTKLLIGAVNGPAVTGGLELALNCDFLVASERARFADTHARVGVMPGWGTTVLLCERIGVARAREMSLTGNFVDASTALQWGLVNHVVEHADLVPICRQLAADCTSIDQTAVRRMLQTYQEVSDTTIAEGWEIEQDVCREWEGAGFDFDAIGARRPSIIERGRAQAAQPGSANAREG